MWIKRLVFASLAGLIALAWGIVPVSQSIGKDGDTVSLSSDVGEADFHVVFSEDKTHYLINNWMFTFAYSKTGDTDYILSPSGEVISDSSGLELQVSAAKSSIKGITTCERVSEDEYIVTRSYYSVDYGANVKLTWDINLERNKLTIDIQNGISAISSNVAINWNNNIVGMGMGVIDGSKIVYEKEGTSLIFDWSDAKGFAVAPSINGSSTEIKFAVGTMSKGQHIVIDPVTVGTSFVSQFVLNRFYTGDKTFIANGRIWAFWYNGVDYGFATSSDNGEHWSARATLRAGSTQATEIAVDCDESALTIQYAFSDRHAAGNPLYYRKGDLNSDGTITWMAAEQTVRAGVALNYYTMMDIDTLSTGESVIAYHFTTASDYGVPYVTMTSTEDGNWTEAVGYPYALDTTGSDFMSLNVRIAPFSTGTFYCVWEDSFNHRVRGRYNDVGGVGWGAEANLYASMNSVDDSVVADDDSFRIVGSEVTSNHLQYMDRDYTTGTWSTRVELYATSCNTRCAISLLNDNNMIVLFHDQTDEKKIYHIPCTAGVWGSAALWFTQDSGSNWSEWDAPERNTTDEWYTLYAQGTTIKFADIDKPVVTTGSATGVGTVSAVLHGEVTNTGGDYVTRRGFQWDTNSGVPYANDEHTDGSFTAGTFSEGLTGLNQGTRIYYRAYTTNIIGTTYGSEECLNTEMPTSAFEVFFIGSLICLMPPVIFFCIFGWNEVTKLMSIVTVIGELGLGTAWLINMI